jgi:hypothetical protein
MRAAVAILVLGGAAGKAAAESSGSAAAATARVRPEIYAPVMLQADVSSLTAQEREMLGLFIDAAKIMDGLFWQQAYGDRDTLLASLKDPAARQFAEFNYGPWDRLDEDRPFVPGVGPKPEGARFYPADMTKQEFEAAKLDGKDSLYTLVERDERGALKVVPYHERWSRELGQAADYVERASRLAADPGLKHYLELPRAGAAHRRLPAERSRLDGHEAEPARFRGRRDRDLRGQALRLQGGVRGLCADQGPRVERTARTLRVAAARAAERACPWPDKYKAEMPGTDSDLNAYDAVYYAGHCNAGIEDDRHQPAERRRGAAAQGVAPAAAQERGAREVRQDHGADRGRADRCRPGQARHVRCVLSPT